MTADLLRLLRDLDRLWSRVINAETPEEMYTASAAYVAASKRRVALRARERRAA